MFGTSVSTAGPPRHSFPGEDLGQFGEVDAVSEQLGDKDVRLSLVHPLFLTKFD
jgi:hypothetical protein